jgi:hypothetical protein
MASDTEQNELPEFRIDCSAFRVFNSFAEADAADRAYWHSRTPEERVRHALYLRRLNYGSRVTEPLQRVFEIVSLKNLRANKLASGRLKDLADLEELPVED